MLSGFFVNHDGVYRRAAAGEHYYDYRGGMWACISVLENSIPVAQSIEKATIIPVALLGAGLIFLCGRIWGKGNASEVNPEWRDCCLLMPALVVLMGWVILMFLTDLNIRAIGRKPIAQVVQTLWLVPSVISFFNGWVWAVLLIPVGSQLCFALGYGGARWECYAAVRATLVVICW